MNYQTYKSIPNALKLCRLQNGLSQKEVTAKLGLKDTALLSRWENGTSLPNIVSVIRLSLLYEVPVEALFTDLIASLRAQRERHTPQELDALQTDPQDISSA
ncbi:MAG: helix-turn-helix transcriptional regulator [Candidatus Jorgensenbacteria bacterium]|nr:helix-turn-helix transcriptional regulator [Candidatus Jorgensenbacteria bacterium]